MSFGRVSWGMREVRGTRGHRLYCKHFDTHNTFCLQELGPTWPLNLTNLSKNFIGADPGQGTSHAKLTESHTVSIPNQPKNFEGSTKATSLPFEWTGNQKEERGKVRAVFVPNAKRVEVNGVGVTGDTSHSRRPLPRDGVRLESLEWV